MPKLKKYVLSGLRLDLFNKLSEDGLIEIKNHKLVVTDKFHKIINKELKKETQKENATQHKKNNNRISQHGKK